MDFFGLGFGEILLVIVIALIVLGPEKVPEFARGLGRMMRTFRQAASGFTTVVTSDATKTVIDGIGEARKSASEVATTVTEGIDTAHKTASDVAITMNEGIDAAQKTTADIKTAVAEGVDSARKGASDLSTAVTQGAGDVRKSLESLSTVDDKTQKAADVRAADIRGNEAASTTDQKDISGKNG